MYVDLRGHHVGQDFAPVDHHRRGRFIAGGFDPKDAGCHRAFISP
jgi:hypothetical protein